MSKQFTESLDSYVFTTKYVVEKGSPIVYISHDADGDWQFLGPEDNLIEEDAMIISLGEIIAIDSTVSEMADLPIGKEAIKNSTGVWQIIA